MNLGVILFILLFISSFSFADEQSSGDDTKIFQLEEITVSENEARQELETPNMTVIPPELLLQGIGSTVDSSLTRQPGIDVQRPQEVGAALDDESIKIRGFGSRRILVTIDGRTLNTSGTAGGYFIDWTTIPLNNIERVEVIKGVSDPRFNNILGGVINLVTRKPSATPVFEVQGLAASFDTYTTGIFHAWKPGKFEYSLSGGYSESNGYLRNGDYWLKNANVNVGYELPWEGKITGSLQYVNVKKGFIVPNRKSKNYDDSDYEEPVDNSFPASDGEIMYGGMGAYPEPGSWWKKEKYYINLGYEQNFSNSNLSLNYWWNHGDREAYNTRASLGRVFHKKFYDDRSFGFDAGYKLFLKKHTVSLGGDFKRLKDDGDRNYSDDYREPFRNGNYVNSRIVGFYLMDDYEISGNFIISPGLRYVSYDGNAGPAGEAEGIKEISMDGIAPSLKVTFNYDKNTLAYLSIARALRMPTPPEHYWHYSPDAGVNTSKLSFKKEDGIMIQGGLKSEFSSMTRIEVSPYYYIIEDYIQFDLINFVSYNISKAKLYGIELEVAQKLGKGFSAFVNYTYQKSKTEGDPFVNNFVSARDRDFDEIPGLPEHKINMGFQYKGKNKEKIAIYAKYVSEQKVVYNNNTLYDTELRVRTQDSFITADIEASYQLTKNLEIKGYIHNIFDRDYQERFGFPAAERNFGLGIKAVF
ncbi:MAG: TonB-dependent receptor [Nitrospirae bacterium]|nr:TonB-dependent receptor [Nitrospirota bacterium]